MLNWNDNDDNNAFHAKLVVMDFDGTISTEVALWDDKEEYNDILTLGLPLDNDGKPLPSVIGTAAAVVPKGAKNIDAAKEFLKYSIEPKVLAAYLKAGLGRFLPPMPSIVENDKAFWLDPKNEPLAAYTRQGVLGPTIPPYEVFNPARAQVSHRACVRHRDDRRDQQRGDAGSGDRQGVQALRGDLRQIPDRTGLRGDHG